MEFIALTLWLLDATITVAMAQRIGTKIIDNGNGLIKLLQQKKLFIWVYSVSTDVLGVAQKAEGKLPIIVFGNGYCSNISTSDRFLFSHINQTK